jgi:hypothetical protein
MSERHFAESIDYAELLTDAEVAEWFKVRESTVRSWRSRNCMPGVIRLSGRVARWHGPTLRQVLDAQLRIAG